MSFRVAVYYHIRGAVTIFRQDSVAVLLMLMKLQWQRAFATRIFLFFPVVHFNKNPTATLQAQPLNTSHFL